MTGPLMGAEIPDLHAGGEDEVAAFPAGPGIRESLALVERLLEEEPTSFGFFQAVRLLQRLNPELESVGHFVDPSREAVRFRVTPAISFPTSEIRELEFAEDGPARMTVNFMGLTGPQGLLPHHYSLLIAERNRARDEAIGEFFDLFHHRMLSLFYRGWEKSQFLAAYERGADDALTTHLRDLIGLGLDGSQPDLPFSTDALLHYTGLLALQPRGAQALEQVLANLLGVPVEIEQFVGRWYPLSKPDLCVVDDDEADVANQLGVGAVVGDEIWDGQTGVRIRVGPLSRAEYDGFLPGGRAHAIVRSLARFFCHDQFDLELQLVLARKDVPGVVLGDDAQPQPIGWSTWINTGELARDADDTIFTL